MKITFLWNLTPFGLVEDYRHFGSTFCQITWCYLQKDCIFQQNVVSRARGDLLADITLEKVVRWRCAENKNIWTKTNFLFVRTCGSAGGTAAMCGRPLMTGERRNGGRTMSASANQLPAGVTAVT
jgi:hypothetical protein